MTAFVRGLLAGRSHLAFLLGLAGALLVIRMTGRLVRPTAAAAASRPADPRLARELPLRSPRPPTEDERRLAHAAWRYFERNTDPRTGLAGSVAGYPSTTMWDLGSQLMGTLAAEELDVIPTSEASRRLRAALESVAQMEVVAELLPNKAYDTRTLRMVDYDDVPAPTGIGWSAIDVGRVAVPLAVIPLRHPELAALVQRILARWNLGALADGTALQGATRRRDGTLDRYQEGRYGYEQYAARALEPFGVPVGIALDPRAHVAYARMGGVEVPHDDREPRAHGGTNAAVLSEPWVLEGLERGLDAVTLPPARAVLAVQARRAAATGRLTAVSEDHIDRPPGFAYSAVLNGDQAWIAFTSDGRPAPHDLTFSTKAALGWSALFDGAYPRRLFTSAAALVAPGEGLYAGRYDETGETNRVLSLNTNAVTLEALAYRVHGPMLRYRRAPAVAEAAAR